MVPGRASPRGYAQLSLPSSLSHFLPFALVYSTSPPVSVCGTETIKVVLTYVETPMRLFSETKTHRIVRNLAILNSPSLLD